MTEIQRRLFALQDEGYRDFHAALMPTVDKGLVIGVRSPALRAQAKAPLQERRRKGSVTFMLTPAHCTAHWD